MCGIAGIYNFDSLLPKESILKEMMASMRHRGPDDEGVFVDDKIGLGFVRLSILDLSIAGHQPMVSGDNRYIIIFNGEIFNYIELKAELEKEGVSFKTKTDTEVLLNAYIKWGKAALHKFNGMWAFVIYDRVEKKLFASRDRFGIKPFYFYKDNNKFIFASEIKSILKVYEKKNEAYLPCIFDYLVFNRTDQDEFTFFKNITKLKHGHSLTIENNTVNIEKWYDLKSNIKKEKFTSTNYHELFKDAVQIRLRSDVPIGVCFSGGLDSSSIVSMIKEIDSKSELNTFSAIYKKGDKGDESNYINLYKNKIKNMYFTTPSAESLYSDLHDFIKTHAEPIPSTSPYAQYKVMELASKNISVTLDGQGADEQLGGYHYFFGIYFKELFLKLKLLTLIKEIYEYRKRHKSNYATYTFFFFLMPTWLRTILRSKEKGYIHESFFTKYKANSKTSELLYNSKTLNDSLLDHFEYKLEHLLKWEDSNSMRFSIEARVPFLDYRLVERTLSLQPKSIISYGQTKVILREAMKGIIPNEITNRQDKIGFGTPEAEWFRSKNFENYIIELLKSKTFIERQIIDSNKALSLYEDHLSGKIDISQEIWKWINLELWFREFIDK